MEKVIWNEYPAVSWRDATPVGNGRLGGCIYGCVYDDRILLNHEDLYNGGIRRDIPDVSSELPIVRKLLDEKKYRLAESHYGQFLRGKGYKAEKGKFYPAFDLRMLYESTGKFENYKRLLDMEKGVCTVSYVAEGGKMERSYFVSHADKCLVVRIQKSTAFTVAFSLERHDDMDNVDYHGNQVPFEGEFLSEAFDGCVYADCQTTGGLHYSGIVKVLYTDGIISYKKADKGLNIDMAGNGVLKNYVKVSNATTVTLLVNVESVHKEFETLKTDLDVIEADYEILLQRHTEIFKKRFNATRLQLNKGISNASNERLLLDSYHGRVDDRLFEKMADYGRYLLVSSSCDCRQPVNLQGVWNGDYYPAWSCTFFNNENIEMEYWQAFAGNLSEATLPLFDLYERFMDDYRHNAMRLYGCRGILLPLFMDNQSGRKDNLQPHVLYWTGSSAWVSAIYFDYYQYTCDETFLLERAYPFMKEAALFYEDFMVVDQNGRLKSYPANSPENRADGDFEGAKEVSVSINPTMDFALLKELLTNLIYTSEKFGIDVEESIRWKDMLAKIPAYQYNEDGAIREWMHEEFKDNYHHRHQSHIYPVFPGLEVSRESEKELFDAFKIAVEKRLCIGLKEQTGWSFAHMANIYARLGDGNRAKECLDNIVRFCTGANLFTYHNDWRKMGVTVQLLFGKKAPFQIDANMGFTAAVYEMLLYSTMDRIELLPALPDTWKEGSIFGVCARGGFELDVAWDEKQCQLTIFSFKGGKTKLKVNGFSLDYVLLELSPGEKKSFVFQKRN